MRINGHGVDIDVPRGWDGEIYRRPTGLQPLGRSGEQTNAVLHLGNFPLPGERGDYGSGAVEIMRADDVFVALFEFGSDSVGKALFSSVGVPAVSADDFAPHTMQRPLPGQSGAQYFFTSNGRAFCLYVALGSHARRRELVPEINRVLETVTLESVG